jgi:hypothetical protein
MAQYISGPAGSLHDAGLDIVADQLQRNVQALRSDPFAHNALRG